MRALSIVTVFSVVCAVFAAPVPDAQPAALAHSFPDAVPLLVREAIADPEPVAEPVEGRGCNKACLRDAIPDPEPVPEN